MRVLGREFDVPTLLVFLASAGVWIAILARFARGEPVVRYQPRRPVPWNGLDVAMVVILYLVCLSFAFALGHLLMPGNSHPALVEAALGEKPQIDHPLVVAVRSHPGPGVILLAFFVAVLMAPVAEEFFFRLLLQGWLERLEGQWRHRMLALRRLTPGLLPVAITSFAFAAPHFRLARTVVDPDTVLWPMTLNAVAQLVTMAIAVGLIRLRTGATMEDFGVVPSAFRRDVGVGVLAFVAMAAPVYTTQYALTFVLPEKVAPDPITLLFFAAVLGFLYFRTHRIVPSVALHMALNVTSLTISLLPP